MKKPFYIILLLLLYFSKYSLEIVKVLNRRRYHAMYACI